MSSLSFWLGYRNVNTKFKVFAGVIHAGMTLKLHYSEKVHLGQQTVGGVQTKNLPAKHCCPRYCAHSNAIHVYQL